MGLIYNHIFMKKTLIFTLLLFSTSTVFSQEISQDLSKSYSKKELKLLSQSDPQKLEVLNFAIDKAIHFVDKPEGKNIDTKPISSSVLSNKYTDYGIQIMDKTQYFTLPNTDKLMVVKSYYHLQLEYNSQQK